MTDNLTQQQRELQALAQAKRENLFGEFWLFLKHNKKWWLLPVLLAFLLLGALIFLGGSGAAPFIYTLF
jgi:hypothetical protein